MPPHLPGSALWNSYRSHFPIPSAPAGVPKGSPKRQHKDGCAWRSCGAHKPTNQSNRQTREHPGAPRCQNNGVDSPYLTEDEPLDEEEQDSRHDTRKEG